MALPQNFSAAMLTDQIVDEFISKKLKIEDWKVKLREDKLNFLKQIFLAHTKEIYFQTVSFGAVPKSERLIPTIESVIYCGTSMPGGMCIQLNYFFKLVLTHIGYDAFIIGVENAEWNPLRSHVGIIVRFDGQIQKESLTLQNVAKSCCEDEQDHLYYVDVGYARAFLEPVPLHDLPYTRRMGGFTLEYRFNQELQLYQVISKGGCPLLGKYESETVEKIEFYFNLTPLQFSDFSDCFRDIFSPQAVTPWVDMPCLSRLLEVRSLDDFEYANCRTMILIHGTRDTHTETVFESYDEMLPGLKKYFPNLDWNEAKKFFEQFIEQKRAKKQKEEEAS